MNAAEIGAISDEIADLGAQIERKRVSVEKLLVGKIALERNGKKFLIQKVRVYQGGSQYRLLVEGAALKKDGTPHERNTGSSPISMLASITSGKRE